MAWSDLTDLLLTNGTRAFSTPAVYQPAVGSPISIDGIFGDASIEVQTGGSVPTVVLKPSYSIKLADLLPSVPQVGDLITIKAVTYRILESLEDGEGGTLLILQK